MNTNTSDKKGSNEFDDLRFDWYSALDTQCFRQLEDEVIESINSSKRSSRGLSAQRKLEREQNERFAFHQIICSLYQAYFTLPIGSKTVSIQLKEEEYTGSRFSYTAVKTVYVTLQALHFINVFKGAQNKHITRIYPNKRLEVFFDTLGLRWSRQIPNEHEHLVVLRDLRFPDSSDPKKRKLKIDLDLPLTNQVIEARNNLYRINSLLTEHCISLDLDDAQLLVLSNQMAKRKREDGNNIDDEESAKKLNFFNVQMRRIFSRGSLEKGGRFYGGWWQGLPGLYRPHILIDGKKVAEVDYGTISLRILYAKKNIDVPIERDLYDIGLDNWQGKTDPRRDAIKTYINAALNDENGSYRLDKTQQQTTGHTHEQLKEKVASAHMPIADEFNSGVGLETQFWDSQIAERVMLQMADEGHVVLPIHDSFIVRLGYEYRLREVMLEVFLDIVGKEGKVSSDYPRLKRHFGLEQAIVDAEDSDPSAGIVRLVDMGREFFSDSLMNTFIADETWASHT